MKKIVISILLTLILLSSYISVKPATIDAAEIRIMIDGVMLKTDVAPQMIDNRVLIPFRAIFEALDAQVYWNNEKRYATGIKDNIYVEIPLDKKEAYVSGTRVILDTQASLVNGRILLPLRFVGEILGAEVIWNQNDKLVTVSTKDIKVPDAPIARGFILNKTSGIRLDLGMRLSALTAIMGQPSEIYISERGFYWYLYNSRSINTVHVGVDNGSVVAFSTNSPNWKYTNDLIIGQPQPAYCYSNQDEVLKIYYDELNQNAVSGYYLMLKEVYQRQRIYTNQVTSGMEKMLFDYINTTRASNGLKGVLWCEKAAKAALDHSIDMGKRLYFAHNTPEGITPRQRMIKEGIDCYYSGENISYTTATGSINSLHIHNRWMNSSGHRKIILNGIYQYTGIGVVKSGASDMYIYATEKFYSLK